MNSIFKIGVLILGVVFLVIFYFHSQNGRYQQGLSDDVTIVDTRTGSLYSIHDLKPKPLYQTTVIEKKKKQ